MGQGGEGNWRGGGGGAGAEDEFGLGSGWEQVRMRFGVDTGDRG